MRIAFGVGNLQTLTVFGIARSRRIKRGRRIFKRGGIMSAYIVGRRRGHGIPCATRRTRARAGRDREAWRPLSRARRRDERVLEGECGAAAPRRGARVSEREARSSGSIVASSNITAARAAREGAARMNMIAVAAGSEPCRPRRPRRERRSSSRATGRDVIVSRWPNVPLRPASRSLQPMRRSRRAPPKPWSEGARRGAAHRLRAAHQRRIERFQRRVNRRDAQESSIRRTSRRRELSAITPSIMYDFAFTGFRSGARCVGD